MIITIDFYGQQLEVEYNRDPEQYRGVAIQSAKFYGDAVDWLEFMNDEALEKIELLVCMKELTEEAKGFAQMLESSNPHRIMNKTHKTIDIPIYFDSENRPTCSSDIDKNCRFLRFRFFGTSAACDFVDDGLHLDRYDNIGCIIPHCKCPLHIGD